MHSVDRKEIWDRAASRCEYYHGQHGFGLYAVQRCKGPERCWI
jgi:hypothetical protein